MVARSDRQSLYSHVRSLANEAYWRRLLASEASATRIDSVRDMPEASMTARFLASFSVSRNEIDLDMNTSFHEL